MLRSGIVLHFQNFQGAEFCTVLSEAHLRPCLSPEAQGGCFSSFKSRFSGVRLITHELYLKLNGTQ